ncbi:DDE-type integrase/transposase/recombinase [Ruthenibacterium lactatiformans]|uniref:DDE-type integrase/transposase/recombinase n=1 Tax=Ruthenibacterium lactatiformans TaxID=1550024 RepID=UPI00210F0970|nr:DDE-type integrase/transposase/recombinase [Ruthenibacterium lactatiformans]MCQ5089418.1 DDE-type integrase/transposase/recombinase [Ruthenibacterium lactatiformans]
MRPPFFNQVISIIPLLFHSENRQNKISANKKIPAQFITDAGICIELHIDILFSEIILWTRCLFNLALEGGGRVSFLLDVLSGILANIISDTSYIPIKQGTLYLSVIRDLFDLNIVAYKTSTRQSIKLVLDTVRMAMEKEEVTAELQLHSDQGFLYASQSYFALTTQYGITPSISRRAILYDNTMAKKFFSVLKSECIRFYKPGTILQAQSLIDNFITFYTHERIIEKRCLFV